MRLTIRALALLLAATFSATALAQAPSRTVTDYANAMNAIAARIDVQVSNRQHAGDMAAAQRLVLSAAMVRRAAEEFRTAEQNSLTEPASSLPAPVPERIEAALSTAAKMEREAADHPPVVDEAHVIFNALMAALPMRTPHSVFYGVLSRDLAENAEALPSDIVVYGFRLIDPLYKTDPVVMFAGAEFPSASVKVNDDRLDVTLPDEVKTSVQFAPSSCDHRASFSLRIRSAYALRHGFWPIVWHTQVLTSADLYVLPTPVIYTAKILASAERTSMSATSVKFRERSAMTQGECEQTGKVEVVVSLPEGAKDTVCAASWVDTSGAVKLASRCVVEGGAAYGRGEITGGAKVCSPDKLCTCPVPAQGWLEATGSYRLEQPNIEMRTAADAPPLQFATGGFADGRVVVGEGETLRHVKLEIARRACSANLDTIDLDVGDNPHARIVGVSKAGPFRAILKESDLRVGAADAVADVVGSP
jgi:hypothetical protein